MKIFSAQQIRDWDKATLLEKNITSAELMEQAATSCVNWLLENINHKKEINIFCGPGNNGGDGLAMARLLTHAQIKTHVFLLEGSASPDNELNRTRLPNGIRVTTLKKAEDIPTLYPHSIIIEALFGTGLNKPITGITAEVIHHINHSKAEIISIDIPGGLMADSPTPWEAITATHTLTFQSLKFSYLLPESHHYWGKTHVLNIGLSAMYEEQANGHLNLTEEDEISALIKPRAAFSHKGNYGHAGLWCGSFGMMGAAVMAAKGCLYSGVGKLTCYVPAEGVQIIQQCVPAAMAVNSGTNRIGYFKPAHTHQSYGAGPGIGDPQQAATWLKEFLNTSEPMVLDADALNSLAQNPSLLNNLPPSCIITPHPGEFARLFHTVRNQYAAALEEAKKRRIYIVLKGRFTLIATPEGDGWFNPTGNPGMARGGMGDILTGIITGLLAQGYSPFDSCRLGVYWHGLAGDIAAEQHSLQCMQPEHLLEKLSDAWKQLIYR